MTWRRTTCCAAMGSEGFQNFVSRSGTLSGAGRQQDCQLEPGPSRRRNDPRKRGGGWRGTYFGRAKPRVTSGERRRAWRERRAMILQGQDPSRASD
eukprot:854442-Rhodomonas_salina.1